MEISYFTIIKLEESKFREEINKIKDENKIKEIIGECICISSLQIHFIKNLILLINLNQKYTFNDILLEEKPIKKIYDECLDKYKNIKKYEQKNDQDITQNK